MLYAIQSPKRIEYVRGQKKFGKGIVKSSSIGKCAKIDEHLFMPRIPKKKLEAK